MKTIIIVDEGHFAAYTEGEVVAQSKHIHIHTYSYIANIPCDDNYSESLSFKHTSQYLLLC